MRGTTGSTAEAAANCFRALVCRNLTDRNYAGEMSKTFDIEAEQLGEYHAGKARPTRFLFALFSDLPGAGALPHSAQGMAGASCLSGSATGPFKKCKEQLTTRIEYYEINIEWNDIVVGAEIAGILRGGSAADGLCDAAC